MLKELKNFFTKITMHWLILLTFSCLTSQSIANLAKANDVYSSLAFVFDTTGSMQDDYQQLKSHAESIMTFVQKRNNSDIKHFVFVPFNDPVVGPVSETFDPKVIMYKLNQIQVGGGGDCPEMGVSAIIQALKFSKPNSYICVFTDASTKDSHLVNEAFELIQRKQSQVIVLKTGDNCLLSDNSYETIASLGSGNVFNVNKEDISKVLEFIKTSMDSNRVNLLSVNVPQKQIIPSPKKLNIDESIKNLQISVSGLHPNIKMVDPDGNKMDEAQGLMSNLNLKNVKIVNILEPIPGEWTIYVTSESAHTIRACGVSTKNFVFGFSTAKPKDMSQTSHRPLKGAKNYVLVDCPDVKQYISCNIQDLYNNGKTEALPILDNGKNLLLCGPFIPYNNPFYVQVFGMNYNGNYFKRITKTSIIPNEPDVPYITTPKTVTAVVGNELHIKCHVESLVPFTVTLEGPSSPRHSWNFNYSSEIELVVRNITIHHVGIYTCNAKNVAGNSESTTNVTVISKPTILEGNDNVTIVLYEGDDYSMKCLGQGTPEPKMMWRMNNLPIFYHSEHIITIDDDLRLIIYDATLNDSNVYTCRASNEAGVTEKHYNVIVKTVKITNSIANETLVKNEFSDVLLKCPLSNMNNKWFKDDVNINDIVYKRGDEPHFTIINFGLKIYDIDELDSSIYTCMNSNETYSFELQVALAPYFVKLYPEIIMVQRNDSVTLDCTTKGYPQPKVLWRKIELALPVTYWTLKKIEFLDNKQKLKITSADWVHNGTYSCVIKNKFGVDKRRYELVVY